MRETILDRFAVQARERGNVVALRTLAATGAAADSSLTWREWDDDARAVAAALVARGLGPGARVAILAGNRVLWPVADVGVMRAGLVSVGLYPTSAPSQVQELLADAAVPVVIVDRVEQLEKVLAAAPALPELGLVVCEDLDDAPDSLRDGSPVALVRWRDWLADGSRALSESRVANELARREAAVRDTDIAALIYTSGSTGAPKAAELPHRYLLASAHSVQRALGLTADDSTLSFLPYCHAAERVFGLYTRMHVGMAVTLVEEHEHVWDAARLAQPTLFGGLPRFFEKASEALRRAAAAADETRRERWEAAERLGRARAMLRRHGLPVPAALERDWTTASEPARECVRGLFGARLRLATSGGATLPVEVAEHLDAFGVTVLGAYGLTEHLCVAMNRPERYAFDTVGLPMPGTELHVTEDGELLVRRSALTFAGYLHRPQATDEAFTADGAWLRTGDLASLDDDGFLRITGRVKELIALSTGKKVAPLPIEARLTEDEWIAQAILVGEGRKYVSALIALRRPAVEHWAAEQRLEGDYALLRRHPLVTARVQLAVDRVNATLSRSEQVKRFALLDDELTVEAGEITPTQKIRRGEVAARHAARVDALYAEPREEPA